MNILVSACLLNVQCRYDGSGCTDIEKIAELLEKHTLIPVCPEQLGGLATPRDPVERKGRKAENKKGRDVTGQFQKGAAETVRLAKLYSCSHAILKERSPSCGSSYIYDGTFSGTRITGQGFTTELLRKNGIIVKSENEIGQFLK